MTRTYLVFVLIAPLALLTGCGSTASGAGACTPVNTWGGPVFACGGSSDKPSLEGDSELMSEPTDEEGLEEEGTEEPMDEPMDEEPEPEPAASLDGDTISLRDSISFEDGKATITDESKEVLDAVAQVLEENSDIAVLNIRVYPESGGSKRKARKLAKKRANSVRKYLTNQGVSGKRLKAKGQRSSSDPLVEFEVAKRN